MPGPLSPRQWHDPTGNETGFCVGLPLYRRVLIQTRLEQGIVAHLEIGVATFGCSDLRYHSRSRPMTL